MLNKTHLSLALMLVATGSMATDLNNLQSTDATSSVNTVVQAKTDKSNENRIIGYLPGWKTPPAASDLAAAGYTHIIIAFGVFSTKNPGQLVSAFDTVNKDYITALHNAGIKVLLSLGGASSSIPDTTTNFHDALTLAKSPEAFQQVFIQSLETFKTQYGFDGFDFDIEQGLTAGGTFTTPQGDIAVLANIINSLHAKYPDLLLTLVPQVANIAATQGYSETWGNYSALVMQTHASLAWVGIQLYNTGCAYGIDGFCYDPNNTSSPDFSVAMATDLLTNWPKYDSAQRLTGFQPYISYLKPTQVVLGYPSPNAQNQSDGSPVTPTSTIKQAIQCLKTGIAGPNSCGTYVPPKDNINGTFGGVFNWEVTYDQANGFKFAKDFSFKSMD